MLPPPNSLQPQMGVVSASIVDPALSLLRSLDLTVQHEGRWVGGCEGRVVALVLLVG